MATSYSIGHNARRRAGIPSNPLETVGKKMRTHKTSDEATADAAAAGSARISVGAAQNAKSMAAATMNSVDEINAGQLQGTLMPKKNVQAGDPTGGGMAPGRTAVLNVGGERLGGAYTVKASLGVTIDPSAGQTMANARIVPSVAGRANPNFEAGMQASSY